MEMEVEVMLARAPSELPPNVSVKSTRPETPTDENQDLILPMRPGFDPLPLVRPGRVDLCGRHR